MCSFPIEEKIQFPRSEAREIHGSRSNDDDQDCEKYQTGDGDRGKVGGINTASEDDEQNRDDEDSKIFIKLQNFTNGDRLLVGESNSQNSNSEKAGFFLEGIRSGKGCSDYRE